MKCGLLFLLLDAWAVTKPTYTRCVCGGGGGGEGGTGMHA